jgi:hypothetical protein
LIAPTRRKSCVSSMSSPYLSEREMTTFVLIVRRFRPLLLGLWARPHWKTHVGGGKPMPRPRYPSAQMLRTCVFLA